MTVETGSIREKRAAYVRQMKVAVDRIVEVLSAIPDVQRVSLFGSYARGRADLFTDLDVLVIMKTDKSFVERLPMLYSRLAVAVDMDLLCYTPEEFELMKERPFLKRALKDEVVLYAKATS
ncbi:MAG: nucleotidyltransferase domain-containing protein [Acidobacteria bacterium]|nr:nucleotidyltransferase domain-containing protein [Acidobacteriota bacterium]